MDAVTFVTFHVISAGANGEDVGATVFVGFQTFVSRFDKSEEIKNVALATGDFGNDVVAPEDEPSNSAD